LGFAEKMTGKARKVFICPAVAPGRGRELPGKLIYRDWYLPVYNDFVDAYLLALHDIF
jgi:hypothetical protein